MIKHLCDICRIEINLNSENSIYGYVEYDVFSEKKSIVQKQEEYCLDCTKKVKEFIKKLKK